MAKKAKKASTARKATGPSDNALKRIARGEAVRYLEDPNVNSVGIGYKVVKGKRTRELCLQFTVDQKHSPDKLERLEALGTQMIPKSFTEGRLTLPTDVIQRKYGVEYKVLAERADFERKRRMDPMRPGISIANFRETAGTLGCIVKDRTTGELVMLSNWHVFHGSDGRIGDAVAQPGPHDDNSDVEANYVGTLVRSYLGLGGDCAVASIQGRPVSPSILGLDVVPEKLGAPQLGDKVVKSGRTTGVTYGIVRRIHVTTKIDYEGSIGERRIGGFEYGPDPDRLPHDGEVSSGGDSGSLIMFADAKGKATNVAAGLHFAGEGNGSTDEHGVACNIDSVFRKLDVTFEGIAPTPRAKSAKGKARGGRTKATPSAPVVSYSGLGWDPNFLGEELPLPKLGTAIRNKVAPTKDGGQVLDYVHFSLVMNKERRMCFYTACNIDGNTLRNIPRGDKWLLDDRMAAQYQCGNETYKNNKLDRGHMVRRLDAVWGSPSVAKKANDDTFYYTNACPQHQDLNQRTWNDLEEYILGNAGAHELKVCVFTGPVFGETDTPYRGIHIPHEYWKVVAWRNGDGQLRATAYLLSQRNMMHDLEAFDYGKYRTYQRTISSIEKLTHLTFADLKANDVMRNQPQSESIGEPLRIIERLSDMVL